MAWSNEIPGGAVVAERSAAAWRVPMGVFSPLWAVFGAAAGAGVAYWWMTRWTQAVNVEALAGFAAKPAVAGKATPIEVVAEPAPVAEVVEAVEAVAAPEPEAVVEPEPAPIAAAVADDLTRMSGIGPKLSAALAARGVTRFAQIAAWTAEDLAEVDAALSLKGRAVREAWVAQAKRLAN
jgi:predicted flap endonuclease-1-like 5' DNA nuclease